eukprot:1390159-Prymnesium_polylepis.1
MNASKRDLSQYAAHMLLVWCVHPYGKPEMAVGWHAVGEGARRGRHVAAPPCWRDQHERPSSAKV